MLVSCHLIFYSIPIINNSIFSHKDFGKISQNLNPNKHHGHDNISILMVKIYCSSTYGPLELIFKETLSTSLFPSDWKTGNIVPIDSQTLKSYHLFILLPICGKIFQRLSFNELFNFFLKITRFRQISQCSNLEILAIINYYL